MNNVYPLRSEEQCYDEASLWVARIDRGLTPDEYPLFRNWITADPRNRECLLELAKLWDQMDSLAVLSELFDPPVVRKPLLSIKQSVLAIAASTLMFLGVMVLLNSGLGSGWNDSEPNLAQGSDNVYKTGVGVHSSVNLVDGTLMSLNTDTLVRVSFDAQQRHLVLERGEIHIEVAHDPQRPLRVQAGNKVVEAVGTAFNVHRVDESNFEVIVTEGSVVVKDYFSDDAQAEGPNLTHSREEILSEGQKLSVAPQETRPVETIDEHAINARLSWRDGKLIFRGETLEEAVAELGRYTPATFEVTDDRIAKVRIAGLFKTGDVEGLLLALRENFNITSTRDDTGHIKLMAGDNFESSDVRKSSDVRN